MEICLKSGEGIFHFRLLRAHIFIWSMSYECECGVWIFFCCSSIQLHPCGLGNKLWKTKIACFQFLGKATRKKPSGREKLRKYHVQYETIWSCMYWTCDMLFSIVLVTRPDNNINYLVRPMQKQVLHGKMNLRHWRMKNHSRNIQFPTHI